MTTVMRRSLDCLNLSNAVFNFLYLVTVVVGLQFSMETRYLLLRLNFTYMCFLSTVSDSDGDLRQ